MASSSSSTQPQVPQQPQVQQQQPLHTQVLHAQDSVVGQAVRWIFEILFYLQLFLIPILVIFITMYDGTLDSSTTHHFHPHKWYPPLLASTLCAGILGFTWHCIIACYPKDALWTALLLTPMLTVAMGCMFMSLSGMLGSYILGLSFFLFADLQVEYGFGLIRGNAIKYTAEMYQDFINFLPAKTKCLAFLSTTVGTLYCCFLGYGIGGARRATGNGTIKADIYILLIILSLGWTMQVMKNAMQVTISRVRYTHFTDHVTTNIGVAFCDTIKHLIGSVSLGSILVPAIELFQDFARLGLYLCGGDCSCAMELAKYLMSWGNIWGFVHVGAYRKGIVQASSDTWEMFKSRAGLEELIDLDLTGTFCFLSGVAVGAICSLVSGIWSIIMYKDYATELSIYAFFIGYFICRLAIAWPQASVSAYYVAYAQNPENFPFESTIKERLNELRLASQSPSTPEREAIQPAVPSQPAENL